MKKISFILTLTFILFLTLSCELFKSDDNFVTGSIIGDWSENNAVVSVVLTTNSAQTAINYLSSTGEIALTGDYQAKLTLLANIPGDEDIDDMLIVANPSGFLGFQDTSYILGLDPTGVNAQGALMVSTNDETEFSDNLYNDIDFNFTGLSLTINNQSLHSDDTQLDVNLNGSITVEQVSIPANSPTLLSFSSGQFYEFGNTVTTFFADSTFTSSEDTGIGDTTGTWNIVGDSLLLTSSQEIEDPTSDEMVSVDTTITFGYINSGNEFIVSQSMDICESLIDEDEEITCEEIFATLENFLSMDEGSITKAELIYQIFFQRIQNGQVTKIAINKPNPNIINLLPNELIKLIDK